MQIANMYRIFFLVRETTTMENKSSRKNSPCYSWHYYASLWNVIRDTESSFARWCCIMIRRLNISGISTQDDFHPHAPLSSLMDIIRAELFNQRNFNLFAVNFSLTLLLSWPLSPVPSITSYLSFLQFVCAFLLPHFTFVSYYYTSVKRQMTKHKRLNGNPK